MADGFYNRFLFYVLQKRGLFDDVDEKVFIISCENAPKLINSHCL